MVIRTHGGNLMETRVPMIITLRFQKYRISGPCQGNISRPWLGIKEPWKNARSFQGGPARIPVYQGRTRAINLTRSDRTRATVTGPAGQSL